ncbi:hypothetical protein [Pseudonocardia sp. TRM90224]|uniref:hypothetical protein n=1 Tax=Pseudonocardia sp. TRM90224 TaxID=2812678 RepID=UPI001E5DB417|nr:hypothetical protein [Pseudonocardia sp. TRM90224]
MTRVFRTFLILLITSAVATTLLCGSASAAAISSTQSDHWAAATSAPSHQYAAPDGSMCFVRRCAPGEARAAFTRLLEDISRIPESVLRRGDKATNDWLRRNSPASRAAFGPLPTRAGNVVGCIASVGAVLVSTLVPAAKLLKIKTLIKELGGVYDATRLLIGAGNAAEKAEALAITLGALVGELTGIKGILENCFW